MSELPQHIKKFIKNEERKDVKRLYLLKELYKSAMEICFFLLLPLLLFSMNILILQEISGKPGGNLNILFRVLVITAILFAIMLLFSCIQYAKTLGKLMDIHLPFPYNIIKLLGKRKK